MAENKVTLQAEWENYEENYEQYTFYHGTSDVFDITRILPPLVTGNKREAWRKKYTNKVFFTTSLLSAKGYAKKACSRFGGEPIVYVVRPVGDTWYVNTNEYVSDEAEIVEIAV